MVEPADMSAIFSNIEQIRNLNKVQTPSQACPTHHHSSQPMRGNGLVQVLFNSLEGLDTLPMESLNVGERFQTFVRHLPFSLFPFFRFRSCFRSSGFRFRFRISFRGSRPGLGLAHLMPCDGHTGHFQIAYLKLYTQYCSNYEIAHSRLVSLKEAKWEVRRSYDSSYAVK